MSISFLREEEGTAWILEAALWFGNQSEMFRFGNGDWYDDLVRAGREKENELKQLEADDVRAVIEQVLLGSNPGCGLEWLKDAGVLLVWLPEVLALVNLGEAAEHLHKDVWEHTKQVIFQTKQRPVLRWAALLHDIGKVTTRTFTADGKVHFHRHSEVGASMFPMIESRLKFSSEMGAALYSLILNHLRPSQYSESWTDSAVRRFAKEVSPYLEDLLDLSRADVTSERPGRRQEVLASVDSLSHRIQMLQQEDEKEPVLPSGIGNEIMRRFGISPSQHLGILKKELEMEVLQGVLERGREMDYYLEQVGKKLREEKLGR